MVTGLEFDSLEIQKAIAYSLKIIAEELTKIRILKEQEKQVLETMKRDLGPTF